MNECPLAAYSCSKGVLCVDGNYPVYLENKVIGSVRVRQKGLYLLLECRCQLPAIERYQILAVSGSQRENLGLCIPMEDCFGIRTRIPAKRLQIEGLSFYAEPKEKREQGFFVPLDPQLPFEYLPQLQNARLGSKEGQVGVYISR